MVTRPTPEGHRPATCAWHAGLVTTAVADRTALPAPAPGLLEPFALFDLDRTLLPGSSLLLVARALVANGELSAGRLAAAMAANAVFTRRGVGVSRTEQLRDLVLGEVDGRPVATLAALVDGVAGEVVARSYPAGRWLIDRHVAAGDHVVLLSASPQEVVEAVADRLGADVGIGTVAQVEDGHYTGRLQGPFCHGEGKLERLRAVLGDIDLAESTAYADSASDLPVLLACGRAVAVNPDRRLRAEAALRTWPVLRLG